MTDQALSMLETSVARSSSQLQQVECPIRTHCPARRRMLEESTAAHWGYREGDDGPLHRPERDELPLPKARGRPMKRYQGLRDAIPLIAVAGDGQYDSRAIGGGSVNPRIRNPETASNTPRTVGFHNTGVQISHAFRSYSAHAGHNYLDLSHATPLA